MVFAVYGTSAMTQKVEMGPAITNKFSELMSASKSGGNEASIDAILLRGNNRDGNHDGTNVAFDLVKNPGFSLFGNKPYKAMGYINFNQRMPAWMVVDPSTETVVLYHNTTYHHIAGDEGSISVRVSTAVCGYLGGLRTGDFCSFKTEMNMAQWSGNYSESVVTDNRLITVKDVTTIDKTKHNRKRRGTHQAVSYIGFSTGDHHVSPTLPTVGRKAVVNFNQIVGGELNGMITYWRWCQLFGGQANMQCFDIYFDTFETGPVDPEDTKRPDFIPANVANADLPVYKS